MHEPPDGEDSLPCFQRCPEVSVDIQSGFPAGLWVFSPGPEHHFDQQTGPDRQHAPEQGFRKNEVGSVLIEESLPGAGMGQMVQPFLHAADIPAGIPQHIVFSPDEKNLSADPFHFDFLALHGKLGKASPPIC